MHKEQSGFRREQTNKVDGHCRNRRRASTTRKQIWRGYQPIHVFENKPNQVQPEEQLPEDQIDYPESERESQFICGDKLLIVGLKNYNTESKEAHYVQIN